jgi:exodeoxyribonuclease VIII
MKHIMVDAETLSVRGLPVLLSLAAVRFDPFADSVVKPDVNQPSHMFYQYVDIDSCLELGAKIDSGTLSWWMSPEQESARKWSFWSHAAPIGMKPRGIASVLIHLTEWIKLENQPPDCRIEMAGSHIWSHGLTADVHWLSNYYEAAKQVFPLGYRAARDTRTLFSLGTWDLQDFVQPEVPHHPAWDAWAQARAVQNKLRRLGVTKFGD